MTDLEQVNASSFKKASDSTYSTRPPNSRLGHFKNKNIYSVWNRFL